MWKGDFDNIVFQKYFDQILSWVFLGELVSMIGRKILLADLIIDLQQLYFDYFMYKNGFMYKKYCKKKNNNTNKSYNFTH